MAVANALKTCTISRNDPINYNYRTVPFGGDTAISRVSGASALMTTGAKGKQGIEGGRSNDG